MKAIVTGANGFLGHHLVQFLLSQNVEVYAMVRASSNLDALKDLGCHMVTGDLLDKESLMKGFEGMDAVFHVAGAMSSNPKERQRLFDVNVEGVRNIIAASESKKVKRLVHVSSVVAVGTNLSKNDPLLNEDSVNVTQKLNYANYDSKRIGEELVLAAAHSGTINAVVVNPGLIYGAGDAKKIIRKGNLMAARGKLPFYTPGGVNVVAVEDVTAAMLEAFYNGRNGERYLLTGDNITIQELLTTISKIAGKKAPHKVLPVKFFNLVASVLEFFGIKSELCKENLFSASTFHWYDNSKAKKELKFSPKNYKEALSSSVEWMKRNHYL